MLTRALTEPVAAPSPEQPFSLWHTPVSGLVLVGLLCLWGGCATLSKDECLRGNWYGIGLTDGSRGYTQARFAQHLEACREYQVLPRQDEYLQGRQAGLEHYCAPANAYAVGQAGADYTGVCPPEREALFLRAYLQGYVHYATAKASNVRSSLVSEVDRLYNNIRDLERRSRAETDTARRQHMERDIDSLRHRHRRLEWSVREQLTHQPLAHWHVYEASPAAQELQRLHAALHHFNTEESQLRSALDDLRNEISHTQERWKKAQKK